MDGEGFKLIAAVDVAAAATEDPELQPRSSDPAPLLRLVPLQQLRGNGVVNRTRVERFRVPVARTDRIRISMKRFASACTT